MLIPVFNFLSYVIIIICFHFFRNDDYFIHLQRIWFFLLDFLTEK